VTGKETAGVSRGGFVGVDFGATNLKAGLVERSGRIIARARSRTMASRGKESVLGRIAGLVKKLAGDRDVVVGVACPGPVNGSTGIVYNPPNLPGWDAVNLKRELEDVLGMPVWIENDANMVAYGEWKFGAGRGVSSLICLTLGTGIGSGLILDGRLYTGAHGFAGELGHTVLDPDGPRCGCGAHGCLETLAGAEAIVLDAKRRMRRGGREKGVLTAEKISSAARIGDRAALDVLSRAGQWVGLAVANVVALLDLEAVVVGGGISRAGELILAPLREAVSSTLIDFDLRNLKIVASELGDDAGILGLSSYSAIRKP
jgi:glucokinase